MNNPILHNLSPRKGIYLTVLFAVVGLIVFMALGILTSALITGNWNIESLLSPNTTSAQSLLNLKVMQMFQTTGLFLFPAIIIAYMASKKPWLFLGFRNVNGRMVVISVLMMIVFIPGVNLIASLNAKIPMPSWMTEMEKAATLLIKQFLITDKVSTLFINLFMVAVLPAVGEELFFRGVLQKYFSIIAKNTFIGVVITALIFSAIHLQFQGFVPRFLLGMIFGYLYVWTKSIWIPIIVHFVNNGLAVVVYFLVGKGVVPAEAETIGQLSDYWQLGAVSLILSSTLLWIIWKERIIAQNQPSPAQASEGL